MATRSPTSAPAASSPPEALCAGAGRESDSRWARSRATRVRRLCSSAARCSGLSALGRQLAFELGLADRQRPLGGRRAPLPESHSLRRTRLARLATATLGFAQRVIGLRRPVSAARRSPVASSASASAACSACAARSTSATSRSRSLRRASTNSVPPSLSWRTSPQAANQTRPERVAAIPLEGGRQVLQALHDPGVRQEPAGELEHCGGPLSMSLSRRAPGAAGSCRPVCGCPAPAARRAARCRLLDRRGRAPAGRPRLLDDRRVEPSAERRGERELVAVLDPQLLAERPRRVRLLARDTEVAAQELVGGRELGAHPGGLATCSVGLALGRGEPSRAARPPCRPARAPRRAAGPVARGLSCSRWAVSVDSSSRSSSSSCSERRASISARSAASAASRSRRPPGEPPPRRARSSSARPARPRPARSAARGARRRRRPARPAGPGARRPSGLIDAGEPAHRDARRAR